MPVKHDVADLVADAADARPHVLAVVDSDGRSVTWAQLEDEVGRMATGLGEAGVLAGQRVMLALPNRLEFVTAYLGALRAQAVAVPVNPRSTVDELARMISDSGARLVVADSSTVEQVGDAVDALEQGPAPAVAVVGHESFDRLRAADAREIPPLQDPEKLAALLYTSGASGRPRAVMLTHRALLANLRQVAEVEPPLIHGDDVVLGVLPLFHVYGLNAVLGGVLQHQAKLVLAAAFDPVGTLELIDDQACSVVPVAPPVFAHWLPLDNLLERLGSVRLMLSGSAPLSDDLAAAFTERTGIEVHQGYGLTEAAPVVTSTLVSTDLQPGSVGAALPGIEIGLIDEAGHVPEGEDPGEIRIRGDNLFSGYWPDASGGPDAEGWWGTGDVGFLDASGDLFLVDRIKDLIIVSGFNVYPVEVEEVIRNVRGVTEAAVIGVEDPATGEAVVAYVVAPGSDPEIVAADVRRHCETRLARFKQPSRIEVVDELPMTVTGKVQKGRLRGQERRRALGLLE